MQPATQSTAREVQISGHPWQGAGTSRGGGREAARAIFLYLRTTPGRRRRRRRTRGGDDEAPLTAPGLPSNWEAPRDKRDGGQNAERGRGEAGHRQPPARAGPEGCSRGAARAAHGIIARPRGEGSVISPKNPAPTLPPSLPGLGPFHPASPGSAAGSDNGKLQQISPPPPRQLLPKNATEETSSRLEGCFNFLL